MESNKVTVVTLTGGRPEAFELCEWYMARQTMQPDEWIVVDDCEVPTECTMGQRVIRPEPFWQEGMGNTLNRNFDLALRAVAHPGVVIVMEDDDWYSPLYIERMHEAAFVSSEHPLVGEGWTKYYNVLFKTYRINTNSEHASLCATAFRTEMIDNVLSVLDRNKMPFVDLRIFRDNASIARILRSDYCIGIKGMPGRQGTGHAHRNMSVENIVPDPSMIKLREWIGEDFELYIPFTKKGRL